MPLPTIAILCPEMPVSQFHRADWAPHGADRVCVYCTSQLGHQGLAQNGLQDHEMSVLRVFSLFWVLAEPENTCLLNVFYGEPQPKMTEIASFR